MNNSKLKTQTLNEYVASNLKMPDTDKLPAMEYTTSIDFRHPSDAADAIKAARVSKRKREDDRTTDFKKRIRSVFCFAPNKILCPVFVC